LRVPAKYDLGQHTPPEKTLTKANASLLNYEKYINPSQAFKTQNSLSRDINARSAENNLSEGVRRKEALVTRHSHVLNSAA
jgi:hypothetical protein